MHVFNHNQSRHEVMGWVYEILGWVKFKVAIYSNKWIKIFLESVSNIKKTRKRKRMFHEETILKKFWGIERAKIV